MSMSMIKLSRRKTIGELSDYRDSVHEGFAPYFVNSR
jgi:hypothetical protein